jgi:hypothetical protein
VRRPVLKDSAERPVKRETETAAELRDSIAQIEEELAA